MGYSESANALPYSFFPSYGSARRRPVKKLLITGKPGVGKTTLIKQVAQMLRPFRPVGFYTEEIRKQGQRVGFQLVSFDGQRRIMSHVDIPGPFRVGRYGVDVEGFERSLGSLPFTGASHVVIDEIGKMECLSEQFQRLVTAILDRDVTCIATIALRGTAFIESVKQRPDVTLFSIDRYNRNSLATVLVQAIQ